MPGAGGPLWNVGGGYGYRPYTAATHGGARRLSGFGQPPTGQGPAHISRGIPAPPSPDPVVQVAGEVVAQLLREAEAGGRRPGAVFLQAVAARIRPGGDVYVARESQNLIRQGYSKSEALTNSLTALVANVYASAIYTGTPPPWGLSQGASGLGATVEGALDSLWEGFRRLVCLRGVGASVGRVVDDEGGAQTGAAGQEAAAALTGGCGPAPPRGASPEELERLRLQQEAQANKTSPWVWVVVGVGVFFVVTGGTVFALTRKKGNERK